MTTNEWAEAIWLYMNAERWRRWLRDAPLGPKVGPKGTKGTK